MVEPCAAVVTGQRRTVTTVRRVKSLALWLSLLTCNGGALAQQGAGDGRAWFDLGYGKAPETETAPAPKPRRYNPWAQTPAPAEPPREMPPAVFSGRFGQRTWSNLNSATEQADAYAPGTGRARQYGGDFSAGAREPNTTGSWSVQSPASSGTSDPNYFAYPYGYGVSQYPSGPIDQPYGYGGSTLYSPYGWGLGGINPWSSLWGW